jgi:hypothetical protein
MVDYHISWLVIALVMALILIAVGQFAKGHWLGILIDPRNKFSLSRLQLVLWTTVLVSALFAIIFHLKTTSIYLPTEVWALMGISTGSTAASVMIKDNKSQQQATATAVQKQADLAAAAPVDGPLAMPQGVLAVAQKPRFSDFFMGEEIADQNYIDIAKVQMFFFTLVAVIGYISALDGAALGLKPPDLKEMYCAYFPALSTSLVTLIGISHVGYLTVKASPKTPTTN